MKLLTVGLAAALLAASFLLQSRVLEKTEVQRLERASQNLGELRASALLPTYIGSLFLGSFRAVAIDILWIQMNRMGEQEHRYFERVEIMDLITKLQPRNPEAWAYMGWDSAYNIANQFRTEEDEAEFRRLLASGGPKADDRARLEKLRDRIREKDGQYRKWVSLGLLKLAEGTRHLPDDPYLKSEVGQALWTKAAWSRGILEEQFLRAVEADGELQEILGGGRPEGRPRTAFELAELWFAKGLSTLEKQIEKGRFRIYRSLAESMSRPPEEDRRHHTTQMGLNIDPTRFIGFIHQVRYLDGILKWFRAERAEPEAARALLLEASESFKRAADQAALFRRLYSPTPAGQRALHDIRVDLCRGMADLCADQAKFARPLSVEDRAVLLARLEPIRWNPVDRNGPPEQQTPPQDDLYLLEYMGRLKQSLGGDAWEYNDDIHTQLRGNHVEVGRRVDATIGPGLKDVDWFHFYAGRPRARDDDPGGPLEAEFEVARTGDLPIQVTALAVQGNTLVTVSNFKLDDLQPRRFKVKADREGWMYFMVNAVDPSGAPPSNSGYWFAARGVLRE